MKETVRVAVAAGYLVTVATLGCEATRTLPASASAAREFRPVGDVQLLPERAPIERRSVGLVPDSKVLWDVLAAIDEQGLDRSGVEVVVREQVVTLRGAATPKQRDAFERAAASAPSVAAVRNEIEVRP